MDQTATQSYATRKTLIAPNVWEYLDYRKYLRDFYESKKADGTHFSYRLFSQKTGVQSPNYMKLIIDGDRNLTQSHARRIGKFCHLTQEQITYFLALVRWNQCSDEDEREIFWLDVLRARRSHPETRLPTSYLSILTQWQAIALMEMIRLKDFKADSQWIQSRFRTAISDGEIQQFLQELKQLELIAVTKDGYRVTERNLKTEDDVPSKCIQSYHRSVIQEGLRALADTAISDREFISNTFSIRKTDLPRLKTELRRFRDLILEMTSQAKDPDEVYQLNLQLFPISKQRSEN